MPVTANRSGRELGERNVILPRERSRRRQMLWQHAPVATLELPEYDSAAGRRRAWRDRVAVGLG